MENLVVTLETAKKLEAAGFLQVTRFRWYYDKIDSEWSIGSPVIEDYEELGFDQHLAATTVQEIADQLPEWIDWSLHSVKGHYHVSTDPKGHLGSFDGDTVAEPLAALWLKLRKRAK